MNTESGKADIDECMSDPCANGGTCKDGINTYTCECRFGYTGTNCEKPYINKCHSNPCQNGGTCRDGIDAFTCECPDGYAGTFCGLDKEQLSSDTVASERAPLNNRATICTMMFFLFSAIFLII